MRDRGPLYLIEILHQTTTFLALSVNFLGCILSKFYIKPQLECEVKPWSSSCILSKFYIKPQHITPDYLSYRVVSYRNSTSNHNYVHRSFLERKVVSYRNSTSNHNSAFAIKSATPVVSYRNSTSNHNGSAVSMSGVNVVSYRNSTSNHNALAVAWSSAVLYLIEILHQTTTDI